jgi:type II secretory pathway component PulF
LAACGAPLADGLEAVAIELRRGRLSRVLKRLAQALRRGVPLQQALASAAVPPHIGILLVRGLRRRSSLDGLLEYARVSQQTAAVPWRVLRLISYPLLVLALLGFVVFVFAHLTAEAISLLTDLELPIPPGSQFLVSLVRVGPAPYAWTAGACLLAALAIWLLRGQPLARLLFIHPLPWIGPLARWNHTRHLTVLLRLLVEEQVSLPEALAATGLANGDASLQRALRRVAHRVEAGFSLAAALECEPLLAGLAPVVAWGEGANMLSEALATVAELYHVKVESRLAVARAVLPPLLLVLVGLTITVVLSASTKGLLSILKVLS